MKNLFWWFCLFFATKAIAIETYICSWKESEDDELTYSCDLLTDEVEQPREADPFKFKIDGD